MGALSPIGFPMRCGYSIAAPNWFTKYLGSAAGTDGRAPARAAEEEEEEELEEEGATSVLASSSTLPAALLLAAMLSASTEGS